MARSTRARTRRSHLLGGCGTCRRRHVKCDQKRPTCRTCRAIGIPCEGFTDQILWMHRGDSEELAGNGPPVIRRHLYTEKDRLYMSTFLTTNLLSGSIDASLAEIELRSRDAGRAIEDDVVVGPFGVLSFSSSGSDLKAGPFIQQPAQIPVETPVAQADEAIPAEPRPSVGLADAIVPEEIQDTSPLSIMDSISQTDDLLHWPDLLGFNLDPSGLATYPNLSIESNMPFDLDNAAGSPPLNSTLNNNSIQALSPHQTPMKLVSTATDLLQTLNFFSSTFRMSSFLTLWQFHVD